MADEKREQIAVVRDGAEWPEHEDRIVGNETGLRNLRRAIDVALEHGEYSGPDLDEWVGVRRVSEDWIDKEIPPRADGDWVGVAVGLSIIFVLVGLLALGVWTLTTWLI